MTSISDPLLSRIQDVLKVYSGKEVERTLLRKRKSISKAEKEKAIRELRISKEAMDLIQKVGVDAQKSMIRKIEGLVTFALSDVFGEDAYTFEMEVSYNKRSMEIEYYFVQNGERYLPLDCCGYGQVDVACFALRLATWALNPSDKTFYFDEPFKNVSKEYLERVGQLVMKLSHKMGFQFIINTHIEQLLPYGDTLFHFTKGKGNTTKVVKTENEVNA